LTVSQGFGSVGGRSCVDSVSRLLAGFGALVTGARTLVTGLGFVVVGLCSLVSVLCGPVAVITGVIGVAGIEPGAGSAIVAHSAQRT